MLLPYRRVGGNVILGWLGGKGGLGGMWECNWGREGNELHTSTSIHVKYLKAWDGHYLSYPKSNHNTL